MSKKQKNFEPPKEIYEKYADLALLGSGGQGFVFRAIKKDSGEKCAIKFITKQRDCSDERFKREVQVLASIDHANVLKLIDSSENPSYLVTPLGISLTDYWASCRKELPPEKLFDKSVDIILSLLDGLNELHRRDLVHRDIKPPNILLFGDPPTPAIADLGIVHIPEEERVTMVPAGNKFAPNIPARYGDFTALPSSDCYGIACLWSWLLIDDPRLAYGYYNWQYHRYIQDERCEIARAVFAVCSDPKISPPNAKALSEYLINKFKIRDLIGLSVEPEQIQKIKSNVAVAIAKQLVKEQSDIDEFKIICQAMASEVQKILQVLKETTDQLKDAGLQIEYVGPPTDIENVKEKLFQVILDLKTPSRGGFIAGSMSRNPDLAKFHIHVLLLWHDKPYENESKFSFQIQFSHDRIGNLKHFSEYFNVLKDGTMISAYHEIPFDIEKNISLIHRFLINEGVWMEKEGGIFDWWPDYKPSN